MESTEVVTQSMEQQSSSWVSGDGRFSDIASAPETVRPILESKKFASIEDMASSYSNLEKRVGMGLSLPEKLEDNHLSEIYNKLGRPDSADKYSFEAPEGITLPDGIIDSFKTRAHEMGMTQSQFEKAIQFELEAGQKLAEAEWKASEEKLQSTYGREKDTAIQTAQQVATKLGLSEILVEKGLDKDADVVIKLNQISKLLSEDNIHSNVPTTKTKEERIREVQSNPAFMDRSHPQHDIVMREWKSIHGIG